MEDVVFLDLETTGLAEKDEIMEIGAVKLTAGKKETYQQLLNPPVGTISPRILKLCQGITEKELRRSPRFADIREQFLEFIGDHPLVCHNAAFEKMMLEKALAEPLQNTLLDSLELFALFKPHFARHGMDYLMRHYLKTDRPEAHRALADAQDTMLLLAKLFADLARDDADILSRTLTILARTDWKWLPYLQGIAPAALRQVKVAPPAEVASEPECAHTLDDLSKLLTDEAIWQEHFPGYRTRLQQLEMAFAVATAFKKNRALFVEAPTGSGKTLAYLLVSLIHAACEKERVYISTNTKNLQQQLMDELPRLARMLGMQNMRFAEMKGIGNYICRRRAEEEADLPGSDPGIQLARAFLANWLSRSSSGEHDDISYWFRQHNPHISRTLSMLQCRREDCTGQECEYCSECFYQRKVKAMQNSHLCTINHALLLTWPGNYPEIKLVVCDEAHVLPEKAFEAFTRDVSSFELNRFSDRLVRGKDKGFLNFLDFHGRRTIAKLDIKPAMAAFAQLKSSSSDVSLLLELPFGSNRVRSEIPEDNEELKTAVLHLSSALESLANRTGEAMREISLKDEDFENSNLFRQGGEYMGSCRVWAALLQDCFNNNKDNAVCRYMEYGNGFWAFRVTPLDISESFFSKVISGKDAMVMTSATLAEKGGYARLARTLGFDRLEKERIGFKDPLPHSYDYAQHSLLAIPSDSPGYGSEDFASYAARSVCGAARILHGRTMVLFNSLERMEKVMEIARAPLEKEGISVLGGRFSSRRSDLEHFREDANAVLFGSRAFFEGVDVKGPALSCIIIDKLSFAYQSDPLQKARGDYLKSKGLIPFIELNLAEAVKTLRQQFGRLIRSETDRGVVLVLDQLGGGMWYCGHIVSELPGPRILSGITLDEIIARMDGIFRQWGY